MRKIFGFLVLVLAGVLFGGVVFAAEDGKPATANSETKTAEKSQGETTPVVKKDDTGDKAKASVDYQEKLVEGKLESFENRMDTQRWAVNTALTAMGFIVTLLAAGVAFITFKQSKEYEKALDRAEKAAEKIEALAEDTEKFAVNTKQLEKQTTEKLEQLDKKAEAKFDELEKKAEEQLAKITEDRKQDIADESEKQRELSTKWNEAFRAGNDENHEEACRLWKEIVQEDKEEHTAFYNWGTELVSWARLGGPEAEKLFAEACEKFEKATSIKNDFFEAHFNWAVALQKWGNLGGPTAEMLFKESCEKFEKAVSLGDKPFGSYNSWGSVLSDMANLKTGNERERLLKSAEDKFLKAEGIKRGEGAYNLACLYALRRDKEKCREWLKVGEEAGTFTATREDAETDEDFESVRGEAWFKEIRWKGEK